jgi:septal ring factor EnvC (AmiA/AmiB activator)
MGSWKDAMEQAEADLAAEREAKAAAKQAAKQTKKAKKAEPKPKKHVRRQKVSDTGGECPRCGSSQWKPKRSVKGKTAGLAFGVVGVAAAPKSQVECLACGKMFRRA